MEFTHKTQYALRTILDIAYHRRSGFVQRRQIVQRQGIPEDFLDVILARFKENGLILSLRGREGGYHLARAPEDISVLEIVESCEEKSGRRSGQSQSAELITNPALDIVDAILKKALRNVTLGWLIDEAEKRLMRQGLDPVDVMESCVLAAFSAKKSTLGVIQH